LSLLKKSFTINIVFRSLLYVFILVFQVGSLSCQSPYKLWTFDESDVISDKISSQKLDTVLYKSGLKVVAGVTGKGIDLSENNQKIVLVKALTERDKVDRELTINFFFQGTRFRYQTFANPNLLIQFGYPFIEFNTTSVVNGKTQTDFWRIPLKGTGIYSYDYYTDGRWHMLSFVIDGVKGKKSVYIDGQLAEGFSREIPKGKIVLSSTDGFRITDRIDQLSFYKKALTAAEIRNLYNKNLTPKHALTRSAGQQPSMAAPTAAIPREEALIKGLDKRDFAPGYPKYNVQAYDQLKAFPSPRFKKGHTLSRNFPWMDITYFHREIPEPGGEGFGKSDPQKAIALSQLLYDKWNYFFEIPLLKGDSNYLNTEYSKPNTVAGALVKYARENKNLQTAVVSIQVQGKPVNAGFDEQRAYVISQNLKDEYYLRDKNGKPVLQSGKKVLSPLAPLDVIYKDAQTTVFYLKHLENYLGRPVDFINENGEFYGHSKPRELLESDPAVATDMKKKGWSVEKYNGWFNQKLDTAYKNEIFRKLKWNNTRYTLYNVTAMQPAYWPDYSMRRNTNEIRRGSHYSTPNLYPAIPENWRQNAGTYNGYGQIADGRKREMALGDKFFAPFVSAGWSFEEENIRPAQWLALLKSMVMLGAEYFHVGYFNITGSRGWPNGKGPFDPRGYAYQAAMPAYAQAVGSVAFDFIEKGVLLDPQSEANSTIYSYRFKASKENHLVMVRKLNNNYLIYGSIQPNSNLAGNVPDETVTEIDLEGKRIKFKISRQGSLYIFVPGNHPKFIQLDSWHQKEHPFYWSNDYTLEAELAENIHYNSNLIFTENNKENDYSAFVSGIKLEKDRTVEYWISPIKSHSKIILIVRTNSNSKLSYEIGGKKGEVTVKSGQEWKALEITTEVQEKEAKLILKCVQGTVEIDKIIFK